MGTIRSIAAAAAAALGVASAQAQDAFDACEVFGQADAQRVLGSEAAPEPVNPKVKRPKVVPTCTYWAAKDGKNISATAMFRFGRGESEAQRAFEDERLKFQTKPMFIGGSPAFWSAKQGQLHVLKGRTWLTVTVGSTQASERDPDLARKLGEALVKKL